MSIIFKFINIFFQRKLFNNDCYIFMISIILYEIYIFKIFNFQEIANDTWLYVKCKLVKMITIPNHRIIFLSIKRNITHATLLCGFFLSLFPIFSPLFLFFSFFCENDEENPNKFLFSFILCLVLLAFVMFLHACLVILRWCCHENAQGHYGQT